MNGRYSNFFILSSLIIIISILVSGISIYTVLRFTTPTDRIVFGKKQSLLAAELRKELLKRPDVCSVDFMSDDGLKLAGLLAWRQHAQAYMIVCHGYRGNKEFMQKFLDIFPEFTILFFDFRAHGQSEGNAISVGYHEHKDVIAAKKFLKEYAATKSATKNLPFILVGLSMGGASILKAAELEPELADVYIIDSTFSHLTKMFLRGFLLKTNLPYYPFFYLVKAFFHWLTASDMQLVSPQESVRKIYKPILFIHSCNDSVIPPSSSLKLYAASKHPQSKMWVGPRCRHAWLYLSCTTAYRKKIMKFLKTTLGITPQLNDETAIKNVALADDLFSTSSYSFDYQQLVCAEHGEQNKQTTDKIFIDF